jgi:hypothetical protein
LQSVATGLLTVFKYLQNEATGNCTNPKWGQPQPIKRPDRGSVQFGPMVIFGPVDWTLKHYQEGMPGRKWDGEGGDDEEN